jgi:hypothetical protein
MDGFQAAWQGKSSQAVGIERKILPTLFDESIEVPGVSAELLI